MTDIHKQASDRLAISREIAREIVRNNSYINYTFNIFAEDTHHADLVVGTKTLQYKAAVKFAEKQSYVIRTTDVPIKEKALSGAEVSQLRLSIGVTLGALEEQVFDSLPLALMKDKQRTYKAVCPDDTARPHGEEPEEWVVHLLHKPKAPLVIDEIHFTHDPSTHKRMIDLMIDALAFSQMDRVLSVCNQVDPKRQVCLCHAQSHENSEAPQKIKRSRHE